jgi:hypothetical protein
MLATAASAQVPPGLDATLKTTSFPTQVRSHPAFDAPGSPLPAVRWRVVEDTGNCCEKPR